MSVKITVYRLKEDPASPNQNVPHPKPAPQHPFTNGGSYDTTRYQYSYAHGAGRYESTVPDDITHNRNHGMKDYYAMLVVHDLDADAPAPANKPKVNPLLEEWTPPTDVDCLCL